MKNIFKSLMLVAVAAMAFTSCNKENFNDNLVQDNSVTMTFVADAPESRTSVDISDGTAKFSWSTGDQVGFYYVDVEGTGKKKKASNPATISGSTATFSASFEQITGATAYNVGAFYPSDSWVNTSHADENPFNNVKVKIPSSQTLTEGTFDPTADLMISKPFMGIELKSDNTKTLQFSRIAAIGKMNLKLEGMVEDGEVIESVKFSFAEGTHFNGPVLLDLENSSYTLGTTGTLNAVTLSGKLVANVDRTAIFFTCFPGEYSGDYTIEVKTDKAKYSKSANITNALVFTPGNILNFNATVGNREEEKVEAGQVVDELNRAFTGATSNSYIDWSGKTSNSTAVYKGNSAGGNSAIQLRSKEDSSGIVTTASGGKARKIVVTWETGTTSGRTLDIYGKDTAYSAATDLYSSSTQGTKLGSIKCGTSTELTISGDYAYIGLRSNSGAMYITSIEITWETGGADVPAEPSFSLSTESLEFDAEGGSKVIEVIAENNFYGAVTATTDAEWLTISGSGNTFTATATENNAAKRSAVITFSAEGAESIEVTVTQAEKLAEDAVLVDAILSFASTNQRTEYSTSKQVWEQNGVKLTNDKGSSTSNIGDYAAPARFYKSSKITIEALGPISKLVFNCSGTDYATSLGKSIGAAATVNDATVTVNLTTTVESYVISLTDGQVRLNSLTVTYLSNSGESGGEEPEDPAEPVKLAAPTNLEPSNITQNSFTLTWDPVANASGYKVTCGNEEKDVTDPTDPTVEFTGLTADTKYTVRVVAVGDGVNYTNSEATTTTVKTAEATTPDEPEGGETAKFVKVTSAPSDWSGTYLIVYEAGKLAFDGSRTTLDAGQNRVSVEIYNNEIQATDAMMAIAFTIESFDSDYYTIKSASGYYIGATSNSNSLLSNKTTQYKNTITYSNGDISVKGSGGAFLRYNASSGTSNERFRYYKSSSYTSQKAIQFYKLTN